MALSIKDKMIEHFDRDGFVATGGFMGPYTEGVYLKFK